MSFDLNTRMALEYQGRRMAHALHGGEEPNYRQAEQIQRRVDQILDGRPGVAATLPDGGVVYDNDSPWILQQAQEVVNNAETPERVLPLPEREAGPTGDDRGEPGGSAAGGIGLLDRP